MGPTIDRRLYIKSLQAIFNKNQQLRSIINQTKQLTLAKKILDQALPTSLGKYVSAYQYENARLTIGVPNSTALSQIRFYIPELLHTFRDNEYFQGLKSIRPKIIAGQLSKKRHQGEGKSLSGENASMLLSTASSMEDGPLKQALTKLVKNSSQNV